MSRYRTVVFDFDGTLADTLPMIYRAFNEVLVPRIGREVPPAELRSHFGPPDQAILAGYLPEEEREAAFTQYLEIYRRDHAGWVRAFDRVHDLLIACAAAGVRIGVMTGKSRVTALISLAELGLMEHVASLVAGDDVGRPKPDPEGVLRVLAELGHQPGEAGVMVGDSAADVYAGRGAGLTTIGVTWGVPEHDELHAAGPDLLVQTIEALADALGVRLANGAGE
jgi:pyrophosphatase PpaX